MLCLVFFNDTTPTEISTLPLHDALPIWPIAGARVQPRGTLPDWSRAICCPARPRGGGYRRHPRAPPSTRTRRSEEHTSELQSQSNLVCRLLLENKKESNELLSLEDYRPA